MKVFKYEVANGSQISSLISLLKSDAAEAGELINSLERLSCVLVSKDKVAGPIFDAIQANILSYKDLLNKRKSAAEGLSQALSSGASSMSAFMEDYGVLDDSNREQIIANLNNARASLNSVKAAAKNELAELDLEGWNSAKSMIGFYESSIAYFQKTLDKINQLSSADSASYAPVSSMYESVISYKAGASSLKTSYINIPDDM